MAYIRVETLGVTMDQQSCTVPVAFVPLNYLNDPETEDLIFGDQLVEGMVVLIEGTLSRANPDHYQTTNPYDQHRIQETARWCRVITLRRERDIITFIGEYGDGTKLKRSYNYCFTWYVKKASMPD